MMSDPEAPWRREYERAAYDARQLLDRLIAYGRSEDDADGLLEHDPTKDELEALTSTLKDVQSKLKARIAVHEP